MHTNDLTRNTYIYTYIYIVQDNVAASNEFTIGAVTDATHHNVKNNVCQGNEPKCKGM